MGLDIATLSAEIASTAMELAGTAKTTATLHRKGTGGTYDPVTDTTTEQNTDSTVEGIKYDLKQTQGTEANAWNTEFLIEGVDAPDGLDEADTVTINAEVWHIVNIKSVPGDAVIILGLRK